MRVLLLVTGVRSPVLSKYYEKYRLQFIFPFVLTFFICRLKKRESTRNSYENKRSQHFHSCKQYNNSVIITRECHHLNAFIAGKIEYAQNTLQ